MSPSGGPPAKNTRAALARREEQRLARLAPPSEEQPQDDLGGVAVNIGQAASTEESQLAQISDPHQEGSEQVKEESREQAMAALDKGTSYEPLSVPQFELEQSFVTAPVSSTAPVDVIKYRSPLKFGSITPEDRSPSPEIHQDKGKQCASDNSPQRAQSLASQLARIRKDIQILKEGTHKWAGILQETALVVQSEMAQNEASRLRLEKAYDRAKQSMEVFQTLQQALEEIDLPAESEEVPQSLVHAQTSHSMYGEQGSNIGSEGCHSSSM
jgi:hypothetical protein